MPLLDKGIDALAGIGGHHVLRHDFSRIVIGLFERHIELAVESLFADGHCFGRLGRDQASELKCALAQFFGGGGGGGRPN